MLALLTSCGRPDLLQATLNSLLGMKIPVIVHEDSDDTESIIKICKGYNASCILTNGIGQHKSIEFFLRSIDHIEGEMYYLHLEDDWQFEGNFKWIHDSIQVLEDDKNIIKVLCRKDTPHPCNHDRITEDGIEYGIIEPWTNDGIKWFGFSWNPGVTRVDLLKTYLPLPKFEENLAGEMWRRGHKVAELKNKVYHHIGDGRSTTHQDPGKL